MRKFPKQCLSSNGFSIQYLLRLRTLCAYGRISGWQVADFGLAKLAGDTNTHVTTRVMGTFG